MTFRRWLLPLWAVVLAGCVTTAALPGESGIAVTGTGRVSVRPDLAVVDVGVEARAGQLAGASADVNRRMREVLARVKALGVADGDIRTTVLRVEPVAESRQPAETTARIIGYRVVNVVEILARDVDRVGAIVDAAVGAGANVVGQIEFRLADPARAETEARRLAVQDAAATAQQMAAAAGVRLGRLVAMTETPGYGPRFPAGRVALASDATPVEAGQLEVVVNVNARYAIEP